MFCFLPVLFLNSYVSYRNKSDPARLCRIEIIGKNTSFLKHEVEHHLYHLIAIVYHMGAGSSIDNSQTPQTVAANEGNNLHVKELRALLKNAVGVQHLYQFASLIEKTYLLEIWDSFEEYKAMPTVDSEMLNCITDLLSAHLDLFPMTEDFVKSSKMIVNIDCKVLDAQNHDSIVDSVQVCCLRNICEQIFNQFRESVDYKKMIEYFSNPECSVTQDSFEYLNVIAQGGFGVVLECRKITTKELFAMKIQPKSVLLKHFRKDKSRVTCELAASVVFSHPYLASVAYAFQTETLVMLVSPISACGDLRRSLNLCPNKRMSLDRVVFYAAEIVSALIYLHKNNIMYRDLKPPNVLLHADGHIMLADFGSLAGSCLDII